jgi:photosystem II stability/assembly factor-like uncharacterized protein
MTDRGRTGTMLALLVLLGAPEIAAAASPRYQAQVMNPDLTGARELAAGASKVLLAWGTDATVLRSEDGRAWRHSQTAGSADLAQLDGNATGSVMVAVGSKGTILRSTDTGKSWSAVGNPAKETDFMAVVSAGERTWIAAGTQGRILRSLDDGRTWALVESNLSATIRALTLDATSGRLLIGGDDGLVGFSRDRGESWQVTAISMPDPVTPIVGFHRFGDVVLATSARGRFLVSGDDADSWDLLQSTSSAYITGAAYDAERGIIVMTGHNGDVLRSADRGRSWEVGEVVLGGTKNFLGGIRYDRRGGVFLATGQSGTVARSSDGVSWSSATADLRGELRGLLQDSRGDFVVYGVGGMLAWSADSGTRWTTARASLDYPLREILVAPRDRALIATSRLGGVLRSADGGTSWQDVTPSYPNLNTPPDLRGLVVAPSGEALIAVGPPGAVLRGNADGSHWRVVIWHDIDAERAFPWVVADTRRNLVLAVEARGALRISRDDGLSWQQRDVPVVLRAGELPFWQGSVLESRGVMLVAGEAGKAARSIDAGDTWQLVDTGTAENLYGSFADEPSGRMFLAGSRGTLLRSDDSGASWNAVHSGSEQELRRFYRDPHSGTVLCFGAHGELLRSQDGGNWTRVATGTDGVLRKAINEPGSNQLLLVGGQGTLLRSANSGRRWEKLDTHTTRHFTSIAADKQTGDLVLVGERIVRLVRQSARPSD